jgi:hypothetical protein
LDTDAIDPKLLLGNWGLDYVDYRDGTLVKDRNLIKNTTTMLSFRKGKVVTIMHHAKAGTLSYSLMNNKLMVGTVDYKIEKLTKNEFVFSDWADFAKEDYKVIRYHFSATSESSEKYFIRKFVIPNIRIKPNGDTVYAFTEDFYPNYIIPLGAFNKAELTVFEDVFRNSYQDIEKVFNFPEKKKGHFEVQFDITKTGKVSDILVMQSSDPVYNKQLIKAVASTAKSWENAEYQNKPIAIQFNYAFDYQEHNEKENEGFDPILYQDLMDRADGQFQKKNYEKAVKLYTKCILMVDDAVEALYKRADCYFTVDAIKNACSDWNYLATRGQKRAEGLYLKHCIK